MKNIFKHIFAMFLKTKVIFVGLITLVFFTAGVFTLLFSTNQAYVKRLGEYKQFSKLQDATINTEFNYFGNAQNNGYDALDPDVYKPLETTISKRQLVINDSFISLDSILNGTSNANKFVSSADFAREYFLNGTLSENNSFTLSKQVFLPIYTEQNGNFEKSKQTYNIKKDTEIELDSENYKANDILIYFKQGEKTQISFVNSLMINGLTKKATFDPVLGATWQKQGIGFELKGQDLFALLGIQQKGSQLEIISNSSTNSSNLINFKNNNNDIQITFNSKKFKLSKDLNWNSDSFQILDPGQTYKLKPQWIRDLSTKIEYINHRYKLKEVENNQNFTGFIKEYLLYLKKNKSSEFKSLENINYWEKRVTTIDGENSSISSADLSVSDLTVPIYSANDPNSTPVSIAQIQKLNNNNLALITNDELSNLSNSNIKNLTFQQLSQNVQEYANLYFYQYLQNYKQKIGNNEINVVDSIGSRQTFTIDVQQENQESNAKENAKQVIHFVNAGISPKVFNTINFQDQTQTQEQQLGRLYQEIRDLENHKMSRLYPQSGQVLQNIKNKIPEIFQAKIIGEVFASYGIDPNFIDLKVDFGDVEFQDDKKLVYEYHRNKKIVFLKKIKTQQPNLGFNSIQNTDLHGIVELPNYQFGYVFKNFADRNWILLPKNIVKIADNNPVSRKSKTLSLLANFLENNNFEIDAKIGKNGWLKELSNYSNRRTIPLIYYWFSANVQNEIDTQKSARSLFFQIGDAINQSALVDKEFLLKPDVDALVSALADAADEVKLVDVLSYKSKNYNFLANLFIRAFYLLVKNNRPTIVNDILANFIDQMILITEKSGSTDEERSLYLVKQIFGLNPLFSAFGVNIIDQIQSIATPEILSKTIKNPIKILNGLKKIIYSINFSQFFEKLNTWFENINIPNQPNLKKLFSTADLVNALIPAIDQQRAKIGLVDIINEINFDAMFSAKVDEKTNGFLGFLVRPIVKKFAADKQQQIIKILNKLNGNPQKPYSNINEGLTELVYNFDLTVFAKNLKLLTKTINSQGYDDYLKLNENQKKSLKNEVFFQKTQLVGQDYLTSLVATLFNTDKIRQNTVNSLIKLINASSKGKDSGSSQIGLYYFLPEVDEEKIDIYDLQFISANWNSANQDPNSITIGKIDLIAESILTKIAENPVLSVNELTMQQRLFLNKYLKVVDLSDLAKIKTKLENIVEIFKIFKFKNYAKSGNFLTNLKPPDLENSAIFANQNSIADVLFYLTNSITQPDTNDDRLASAPSLRLKPIYISASSDLISDLQKSITENPDLIINLALRNYRFWIRFVAENNLSNFDLQQAFNKLFNEATSGSLVNDLNNTKLLNSIANLETQEGLFDGLPAPSRSILEPYLTSLEFLKSNTNFKNLLNDPVFDKDYLDKFGNKQKLKNWLEENSRQLVENLGYLAYYSKNYPFSIRFDESVKHIMENYLLNDQFSDSAFKKNFMLDLVNEFASSNPLLAGLNLDSLGLGSFFSAQLPQIPLWFASNPQAKSIENKQENNFNLAFILQSRLPKISQINVEPSKVEAEFLKFLSGNSASKKSAFVFVDSINAFSLDYYQLKSIANNLAKKAKEFPEFFGINISKFYNKFIEKIIITRLSTNSINYDDNRAYVVKINKSFLDANKKEIFNGKIPDNASDIEKLIEQLDQKYVLNAGGLKYIIVGTDFTIDYLYPVIDEKNINLDPSNQALAYVNKFGFDKARYSFRSNPAKNYLLVKLKPGTDLEKFKKETDELIAKNFATNHTQRTFGASEIDFLNPERSMRISVGTNIMWTFSNVNLYLTLFLSVLVLFAVAFIIKRYISTNNKVLGILRAQGYSLFEIASSFLSVGLVISLIGGGLGYLVGFFTKIPLVNLVSKFWEFDVDIFKFEPLSFVFSIILPFAGLSILIYLVILWNLKQKPNQLLSGITEVNSSKFAQKIGKVFWKTGIINKFSISLVINSIWKIISLIVAIVVLQFILIFSLSSHNIFQNTIKNTYENRHYNYKLNLYSPTKEGGPLVPFDAKKIEKNLYVPLGEGSEINLNSPNYFRPGSAIILGKQIEADKNNLIQKTPVVLTRSGLNLKFNEQNSTTIFDIVLANLPESLRNNIFAISNKVVAQMEKAQNIPEKIKQKQSYFKYLVDSNDPNQGRFWYYKYDLEKNEYRASEVSIVGNDKNRDAYRKFLVESYLNPEISDDFTVSFSGVAFKPDSGENLPKNQVYTYISTNYVNGSDIENGLKIYGYNTQKVANPIFQVVDSSGNNLLEAISKFQVENEVYPLVVNYVFAKKHNLGIDSVIELPILNNINRFENKIRGKPTKTAKFKIIGISNTFINSELITSQNFANKLLGLDLFDQNLAEYNLKPFNGIILSSPKIDQILTSFSLYSPSGYWAGSSEIKVESLNQDDTTGFFANIFAFSENKNDPNQGALQISGFSKAEIIKIINWNSPQNSKKWLDTSSPMDFKTLTNPSFVNQNIPLMQKALSNFNEIYGDTIYQIVTQGVEAKNIETNFISNFSSLFEAGINMIVIIFLVVALIILLIIASSIINENQQNIAILDVLGYSNKVKIRLFYGIYLPVVAIGSIISVPLVMILMSVFNSYVLSANSIYLALGLSAPVFFGALVIVSVVFVIVLAVLWYFLTKRKSVYIIKEKT
ncbi:ABC transporter permease [Mycoplasma sp. 'Moose RK']|uniref:ABC transporter permease n=1 Tax=Mycoplasma sp. 'Moose RK' TaxID=2780095 RepID=UPI0018C2FAAD|nr:ABC transporter permease [Mycoplasma sp. 'Moose RK']MBG0730706.1 ABC transporter permease [Mycoplasma sp. 'Moose RK']